MRAQSRSSVFARCQARRRVPSPVSTLGPVHASPHCDLHRVALPVEGLGSAQAASLLAQQNSLHKLALCPVSGTHKPQTQHHSGTSPDFCLLLTSVYSSFSQPRYSIVLGCFTQPGNRQADGMSQQLLVDIPARLHLEISRAVSRSLLTCVCVLQGGVEAC